MTTGSPQEIDSAAEEARMREAVFGLLALDGEEFEVASQEFIDSRLTELTEKALPTSISGFQDMPHEGFIHPETEIFPRAQGTGFKVDDPEIYRGLLDFMKKFSDKGVFDKLPDDRRFRAIGLYALEYFSLEYFARTGTHEERHRLREEMMSHGQFLIGDDEDEETVDAYSISDIRPIGACAEKAAVAQNCLAILGFDTRYAIGRLEIEGKDEELHAFNLLADREGKIVIYDPTNPLITEKPEGSKTAKPALYKGGNQLLEGEPVSVNHIDLAPSDEGGLTPVSINYTFYPNYLWNH